MRSPLETWGGISSGFPVFLVVGALNNEIAIIDNGNATFYLEVTDTSNPVTITFIQPERLVGDHVLAPAQLAALETTPVNLVAPVISGPQDPVVGAELSAVELGFWFAPSDLERTFQWYVDGGAVDDATDPSSFITTGAGIVTLAETLGGVTVMSNPIAVGSASSFAVVAVDSWSVDAQTTIYSRPIVDLSAGDNFILNLSSISSNDYFTSASLDGVAGALVAQADQGNSEVSQVWEFTGIAGSSGELVLRGASNLARRMSFQLVAVEDYQVVPTNVLNTGDGATATILADMLAGDVALATFGKARNGAGALFDPIVGFAATQNVNQSQRPTVTGFHVVTVNEDAREFSVTGDAGQRNVGIVTILRAAS